MTNLATRQPGKRYWKNTSNPNMRGSSTSVTSVTTNHRLSNNLRFISTQNMRELQSNAIKRRLERIHCDVTRGCNMERFMCAINVTARQQPNNKQKFTNRQNMRESDIVETTVTVTIKPKRIINDWHMMGSNKIATNVSIKQHKKVI